MNQTRPSQASQLEKNSIPCTKRPPGDSKTTSFDHFRLWESQSKSFRLVKVKVKVNVVVAILTISWDYNAGSNFEKYSVYLFYFR